MTATDPAYAAWLASQQPAAPAAPQYAPPQPPQDPAYAAWLAVQGVPAPPQYQPPAQYAPAPQYAPPVPGVPPAPYGQQPQYAAPSGYPQGGYTPAAPVMPAVQNLDLSDFYGQPKVGQGEGWKFEHIGQTHVGMVSRPMDKGDVVQVIDFNSKQPAFWRDGRPKVQMVVPVTEPDGKEAVFYLKGKDQTKLSAAMTAAGSDGTKPPEQGAFIRATFVAVKGFPDQVTRAMTPQQINDLKSEKQKEWEYVPPGQPIPAHWSAAPAAPAAPPAPPAPAVDPAYAAFQAHQAAQAAAQAAPPVAPPQAPAPAAPAAPAPAPANGLTAAQQTAMAALTGG